MVAGATGIDLFLLVIDAREGARAQTHEHLAILRLLGVETGVVAVTKADAADPEPALAEARELDAGRGGGRGQRQDRPRPGRAPRRARAERRHACARANAPARRACSSTASSRSAGIGTVATGTLWSGSVGAGDELRAEPGGLDVRVRSVAGARPAGRARRGRPARGGRPDRRRPGPPGARPRPGRAGRLRRRLPPRRSSSRSSSRFPATRPRAPRHDRNGGAGRAQRTGAAQLRLSEPVVAARGDRVVLRAGTTVAGAVVLEPIQPRRREAAPHRHASTGAGAESTPQRSSTSSRRPAACRSACRTAGPPRRSSGRAGWCGSATASRSTAEPTSARGRSWWPSASGPARSRSPASATCWAASRRTAQLVLERLDGDGVTLRVGDERRLRRRETVG